VNCKALQGVWAKMIGRWPAHILGWWAGGIRQHRLNRGVGYIAK
jgi:hypothetical protein